MHISNVGKLKRESGKNLPVSPDPKGLTGLKWFKPIWSKNIINLQNVTYRRYSITEWDESLGACLLPELDLVQSYTI